MNIFRRFSPKVTGQTTQSSHSEKENLLQPMSDSSASQIPIYSSADAYFEQIYGALSDPHASESSAASSHFILATDAPTTKIPDFEVLTESTNARSRVFSLATNESFEIGPFIAKGSFGKVNIVSQKQGDKTFVYAVKSISNTDEEEEDQIPLLQDSKGALEDIKNEVGMMVRGKSLLTPHRIFVEPDNSAYHLLMPLMQGTLEDLYTTIDNSGLKLRAELANYMQRPLAEALSWLHKRNVLLRDIKPANILVNPDGRLVFSDFGLAGEPSAATYIEGTVPYLAPEIFRTMSRRFTGISPHAPAYSEATDYWSLGVTFLTTLMGRNPFEQSSWTPNQLEGRIQRKIDGVRDMLLKHFEVTHQLHDQWPSVLKTIEGRFTTRYGVPRKHTLAHATVTEIYNAGAEQQVELSIFALLRQDPKARTLALILGNQYLPVEPRWRDEPSVPSSLKAIFMNFDSTVRRGLKSEIHKQQGSLTSSSESPSSSEPSVRPVSPDSSLMWMDQGLAQLLSSTLPSTNKWRPEMFYLPPQKKVR